MFPWEASPIPGKEAIDFHSLELFCIDISVPLLYLSLSSSFHLIFPHFQSFFSFAARLELSITMPQGWLLFFTCSPGSCPCQSDERRASQRPVFAMRKIATGPSQEITAVDAGIPTGQDLDAASYGPRKKENRLGRFDCASRGRGRNGSSSN